MASPHLLRPFSSRQLWLVEGDGQVVSFGVSDARYAGPTLEVHAPTLTKRVSELAATITTVVFFDNPVPDAELIALIDDMLAVHVEIDADVLVRLAPMTEAVKQVEGDVVVGSVDRADLAAVCCPEVIDRTCLERAMAGVGDRIWVNPTALVAAEGAKVAVYEEPRVR